MVGRITKIYGEVEKNQEMEEKWPKSGCEKLVFFFNSTIVRHHVEVTRKFVIQTRPFLLIVGYF